MRRTKLVQEIPESKPSTHNCSEKELLEIVAKEFSVKEDELLEMRRGRGVKATARNAAVYLCRKRLDLPLKEVANLFGYGHYGSVAGVVNGVDKMLKKDAELAKKVSRVVNKIIRSKT